MVKVHSIAFANGDKVSELAEIGTVGKKNTGTHIRFWPEAKYFDSINFSVIKLKTCITCQGGIMPRLADDVSWKKKPVKPKNGITKMACRIICWKAERVMRYVPVEPFIGSLASAHEAVDWALLWLPEGGEPVGESYVNLIPTGTGRYPCKWFTNGFNRSGA